MRFQDLVLVCLIAPFCSPAAGGQDGQAAGSDDLKCQYMLLDKAARYPVTRLGWLTWRSDASIPFGDFDGSVVVPPGKWLWLAPYGIEASQQGSERGRVRLTPLDRLRDGELCVLSCGPAYRVFMRDVDLIALSRFKSLRGLGIAIDAPLDDAAILGRFAELESLGIQDRNQCFFKSKNALTTLGCMRRLRSLALDGSPCDEKILQTIGTLKKLESLSLSSLKGSDRGLREIQAIEPLREVVLASQEDGGNSAITDEGIAGFSAMQHLEAITIGDAPNVSDEAVAALRAKLPRAVIWVGNRKPAADSRTQP